MKLLDGWLDPPADAPPREVTGVWGASLEDLGAHLDAFHSFLSEEEVRRAERFRAPRQRQGYVLAHGFLREVIARYTDSSPRELRLGHDAGGKPFVMGRTDAAPRFNMSHAGELVLVAVARGYEVGVDVEEIRTDLDHEGIARHFFSSGEIEQLQGAPDVAEAFFRCWTRKEAVVKALGGGLREPLASFTTSASAHSQAVTVGNSAWIVTDIELSGSYCAALALPRALETPRWAWRAS